MKANRNSFLVKLAVLAVLAVCFGVGAASAQNFSPVFKGTFTLPFEARWGQATLAPGDYSFSVDRASGPYLVTVRGEGETVIVMAMSGWTGDLSGHSHLTAVRTGRGYRIRSLEMTDLGQTLTFGIPKAERRQIMAHVLVPIERVPVVHNGK
jgi:hypothetical protein